MINVSITKDPIIKDKESSMDSCSSCIPDRFFTSAAFEATIRFFTLTFLPSGDVSLSKGKEIFFGPAKVKSTWEWKRSGLKSMQIRGKVEGKTFHSTSGMFAGEWSVTWN